jgi:hypothetical protein
VAFEWLYFGSLAIGLVRVIMDWEDVLALDGLPPGVMLAAIAASLLLYASLILLVSRRRSRVALWVLLALTLTGMLPFVGIVRNGIDSAWTLLELVLGLAQILALVMLFTPSARAWLRADPAAASEALGRTFE